MARVTHVKSARQRYAMVPDIDPETGKQKVVPVMRADGTPKMTRAKNGRPARPVTRRLTVVDKTKPLPNLRCDFPGCEVGPVPGEIVVGAAYKHITPKSGPYGGTQRNRHAEHPSWQVWDYSHSVRAQAARLQHDMEGSIDAWEPESTDDFDDLRQSLVDEAQSFLDEREDTLSNLPEQLQDGSPSQEYVEAAESWVEALGDVDAPDDSDALEDCDECDGTGEVSVEVFYVVRADNGGEEGPFETEQEALDAADGDDEVEGREDDEECTACDGGKTDALREEWVDEAREALREAVYELGI
jgi:hypothetical protein